MIALFCVFVGFSSLVCFWYLIIIIIKLFLFFPFFGIYGHFFLIFTTLFYLCVSFVFSLFFILIFFVFIFLRIHGNFLYCTRFFLIFNLFLPHFPPTLPRLLRVDRPPSLSVVCPAIPHQR